MAMIGKVRRMHHRQKKSVREIARATSLSRNTCRRRLNFDPPCRPNIDPGLDAVLVAVSLALEGAPPSGRVSVEHLVNVLARLNEAPPPACAATTLQAKTPPRADTARYDRLRQSAAAQPGAGEVDHA
jgi:hypothetical protein